MFTSNEYEEESGPILYNGAIILDNRPNFVHSKFLFSKLSLLFIFPPKQLFARETKLSRIIAALYRIRRLLLLVLVTRKHCEVTLYFYGKMMFIYLSIFH